VENVFPEMDTGKVDIRAEIGKVETRAEIGKVDVRAEIGKVETLAEIGKVESVRAEIDTSSWLMCASEPWTVRVALAECCSMHSVRLTDLLGTVDTSEKSALDLEEFVHFMVTRCGHQGGRAVLNKIFDDLDEDGSGLCSFEELNRWMRNTRRTRQERLDIVRTLTLTSRVRESESAWDEARLRSEIQYMLLASGCRTADLCEAWDDTRKGVLSRTALLRKIKCLVEDEELWNSRVRAAAKAVLARFDSNEVGVSLEVVWQWLLPRAPRTKGLGKDAARQKEQDRRALQHSLTGARLGGTRSAPVLSDRPTRQTREHRVPPAGPALMMVPTVHRSWSLATMERLSRPKRLSLLERLSRPIGVEWDGSTPEPLTKHHPPSPPPPWRMPPTWRAPPPPPLMAAQESRTVS